MGEAQLNPSATDKPRRGTSLRFGDDWEEQVWFAARARRRWVPLCFTHPTLATVPPYCPAVSKPFQLRTDPDDSRYGRTKDGKSQGGSLQKQSFVLRKSLFKFGLANYSAEI